MKKFFHIKCQNNLVPNFPIRLTYLLLFLILCCLVPGSWACNNSSLVGLGSTTNKENPFFLMCLSLLTVKTHFSGICWHLVVGVRWADFFCIIMFGFLCYQHSDSLSHVLKHVSSEHAKFRSATAKQSRSAKLHWVCWKTNPDVGWDDIFWQCVWDIVSLWWWICSTEADSWILLIYATNNSPCTVASHTFPVVPVSIIA